MSNLLHTLSWGDVIGEHRRRFPELTALVDGETRLTFPQLDQRSNQLARALADRGVGVGDRVLWFGKNSFRCIEALLACAKLGAIFCPANWRQSVDELSFVVVDLDPKVIFWQQEMAEAAQACRAAVSNTAEWIAANDEPDGYEGVLSAGSPADLGVAIDPSLPLLAIYTAAFGGRPAAALLSHLSLLNAAVWLAYIYDIDSSDVLLAAGPVFHMGVFLYLLPTFVLGGTTVVIDTVDPEVICRLTDRERCTLVFPLMPFTIDAIVELNANRRYDLSSLRAPDHSPEWNSMVRKNTARAAVGAPWGQTETCGPVTWGAIGPRGAGRFGRSSPLALVRVFNEDGEELPCGEVGELVVRGPTVADGYWRRPELNATQFSGGWRRSNDLGRRETDGSITFIGPKTKMIKSGVENIYPAEVEGALKQHPGVADAAIIGVPDEKWVQSVKAIVVLRPGELVAADGLIAHCKALIASYKKPRSVEFVSEIPRNGFLVDYDALDARFGGGGYPGGSTRSS